MLVPTILVIHQSGFNDSSKKFSHACASWISTLNALECMGKFMQS